MILREQHTPSAAGTRLDRYLLTLYPWLDRSTVDDLIASGHILLNHRPARKGAKLAGGDVLDCRNIPEPVDLRLLPNPDLPLAILYEDSSLLALDKPAGLPVHPHRFSETNTLANALIARHPALADIGDNRLFPALVHRIDTQTSGLVLAAKTPAAHAALRSQFRRLAVEKHYTALVHGSVDTPGRLDAPLTHKTRSPCKMTLAKPDGPDGTGSGFPAVTAWTPIQTGPVFSLLDVTIFTGVTHQIRCHLAAAGHPIVGDTLYSPDHSSAPHNPAPWMNHVRSPARNLPLSALPRHWLHASRIRLLHPATGNFLDITCPLPPDWPQSPTGLSLG